MLTPTGIITPVRVNGIILVMLLYDVCTAGEFVWNEGGVVQLPEPYITLCDDFFKITHLSINPILFCVFRLHARFQC